MQPPLAYNQIVADVQPPPPSYDQITAARLCGAPSGCHVGDSSLLHQTVVDIAASPTKTPSTTLPLPNLRSVGANVERVAPLLDPRLMCPLSVDTSVEYEMPASACPPKNCEPLLMVHPQYFEFRRHRRLQGGWCRCQLCCFYGRDSGNCAEAAGGVDLSAGAVFRQSAAMLLKSSASAASRTQRPEFKVPKEPTLVSNRSVGSSGSYSLRQLGQVPQQQQQSSQPHSSAAPARQCFGHSQCGMHTAQSAAFEFPQNPTVNPSALPDLTQYSAGVRGSQAAVQNPSGFALDSGLTSGGLMSMHPLQNVQNMTQPCQCAACLSSSAASKVRYQLPVRSGASAANNFPVCDNSGKRKRPYSTVFSAGGGGAGFSVETAKRVSPIPGSTSSSRSVKRSRLCSDYMRNHFDSQFSLPNFAVI